MNLLYDRSMVDWSISKIKIQERKKEQNKEVDTSVVFKTPEEVMTQKKSNGHIWKNNSNRESGT